MLIWGIRTKVVDLGQIKIIKCVVCQKTTPFHLYLTYKYLHLFFIFGLVLKEEYMLACEHCHNGIEIKKTDISNVLSKLIKKPIPFFHKYGLLIFFVFIGLTWIIPYIAELLEKVI